eukprot:UN33941
MKYKNAHVEVGKNTRNLIKSNIDVGSNTNWWQKYMSMFEKKGYGILSNVEYLFLQIIKPQT